MPCSDIYLSGCLFILSNTREASNVLPMFGLHKVPRAKVFNPFNQYRQPLVCGSPTAQDQTEIKTTNGLRRLGRAIHGS